MNSKKSCLFSLVILSIGLNLSALAVEYKTLVEGQSLTTSPTSLIEITSHGSASSGKLEINLPSVTNPLELPLNGSAIQNGGGMLPLTRIGNIVTGAESIKSVNTWVTVKITPAAEINAAGPTSVLVLPENAQGNYDLTVESSSDLVTWTPIHSQTVQSNTTSRMFRVRIAKK
jgi:hypothetical protein